MGEVDRDRWIDSRERERETQNNFTLKHDITLTALSLVSKLMDVSRSLSNRLRTSSNREGRNCTHEPNAVRANDRERNDVMIMIT